MIEYVPYEHNGKIVLIERHLILGERGCSENE